MAWTNHYDHLQSAKAILGHKTSDWEGSMARVILLIDLKKNFNV
jgi:hypothetical protein